MQARHPLMVLLTLAVSACSQQGADEDTGGTGAHGTRHDATPKTIARSGEVTVVREASSIEAPYVIGDQVYGLGGNRRPEKLASEINTAFLGTLAPAVVPSPDGRSIVYTSFHRERPVVRLYDVVTNEDRILDEGAYSVAWRSDGTLAYFKGPQAKIRDPRRYLGHAVVRKSPAAPAVRWTEDPGRYVMAAWAGKRLLIYRVSTKAFPDLLVLDGPRRIRKLAESGALIAVSPDGTKAFVARYGASPPVVRILNLAHGNELARFNFGDREARRIAGRAVRFVTESGSWIGDMVVAAVSHGVVVFRVHARRIVLEQLLRFDANSFPVGVFEPRPDHTARRIVIWGELQARPGQAIAPAAVLQCDRITLECVQGPKASSIPGPRVIYNPSRP